MAFRGTASVAMWANVNTQGTHSLRDSYNVSGIADVGGNTVRIEIDDNMDNTNYCVVVGCIEDNNSNTSRTPRIGNHTRKDLVSEFSHIDINISTQGPKGKWNYNNYFYYSIIHS